MFLSLFSLGDILKINFNDIYYEYLKKYEINIKRQKNNY